MRRQISQLEDSIEIQLRTSEEQESREAEPEVVEEESDNRISPTSFEFKTSDFRLKSK